MIILGLDVSSATIGWSLLNLDKNNPTLIECGHIKPMSKDKADKKGYGMIYRGADAYDQIADLLKNKKPDLIVIEDFSKKFSKGKSSANTIITLAVFNSFVALACLKYSGKEPLKFSATEMRSNVGKFYKQKIVSKDDVFPFICNKYQNFIIKNNRNNKTKTEYYDEADAIFTALACIIIKY